MNSVTVGKPSLRGAQRQSNPVALQVLMITSVFHESETGVVEYKKFNEKHILFFKIKKFHSENFDKLCLDINKFYHNDNFKFSQVYDLTESSAGNPLISMKFVKKYQGSALHTKRVPKK